MLTVIFHSNVVGQVINAETEEEKLDVRVMVM